MPRPLLLAFLRYVAVIAIGNLVWEAVQMPLYTIWVEGSGQQIVYAWAHCTVGDVLIGAITLCAALVLCRSWTWPHHRFRRVAVTSVTLALAYTVFSEWLNVEVRHTWAYRDIMPTLPWLGTGLSPLLQWVVVPLLALWVAKSGRPIKG